MFNCIICNRSFKRKCDLSLHKPFCKGVLYCQNHDCRKILTKFQVKYCSHSCSSKIGNINRFHSTESRIKCSLTQGGNGIIKEKRCIECGNNLNNFKKIYCSIICQTNYYYKNNIKLWFKNPEFFQSPRSFMKRWLIENYGEKCSICGWNKINPKTNKIPIEFHHHDGNWKNNKPENICLLCPSCHSLTPTYRIGNKGNGREYHRRYYKENPRRK